MSINYKWFPKKADSINFWCAAMAAPQGFYCERWGHTEESCISKALRAGLVNVPPHWTYWNLFCEMKRCNKCYFCCDARPEIQTSILHHNPRMCFNHTDRPRSPSCFVCWYVSFPIWWIILNWLRERGPCRDGCSRTEGTGVSAGSTWPLRAALHQRTSQSARPLASLPLWHAWKRSVCPLWRRRGMKPALACSP